MQKRHFTEHEQLQKQLKFLLALILGKATFQIWTALISAQSVCMPKNRHLQFLCCCWQPFYSTNKLTDLISLQRWEFRTLYAKEAIENRNINLLDSLARTLQTRIPKDLSTLITAPLEKKVRFAVTGTKEETALLSKKGGNLKAILCTGDKKADSLTTQTFFPLPNSREFKYLPLLLSSWKKRGDHAAICLRKTKSLAFIQLSHIQESFQITCQKTD